ncbi:MAG: hypothetical protein NVSMB9_29800 [Isosphaeraceae bacterium]
MSDVILNLIQSLTGVVGDLAVLIAEPVTCLLSERPDGTRRLCDRR